MDWDWNWDQNFKCDQDANQSWWRNICWRKLKCSSDSQWKSNFLVPALRLLPPPTPNFNMNTISWSRALRAGGQDKTRGRIFFKEQGKQHFFFNLAVVVSSLGDTPMRATRVDYYCNFKHAHHFDSELHVGTKLFHSAVNDPYPIKSISMSGFS